MSHAVPAGHSGAGSGKRRTIGSIGIHTAWMPRSITTRPTTAAASASANSTRRAGDIFMVTARKNPRANTAGRFHQGSAANASRSTALEK